MSKKRASVSVMAVFVFAIIAFLTLFLFSRIEHRAVMENTQKDAVQSGYDSESLLYIAWGEVEANDLVKLIEHESTRERPRPSFRNVNADHAFLSPVREENGYSGFELDVQSTYRGITTRAILKGDLIDPVFETESGVLNPDEDPAVREIVVPWIRDLADELTAYANASHASWVCVDGEMHYASGRYLLREEGRREQSFYSDLPARGRIAKRLTLKTPLDMKGLLVFEDGAKIEGVVRIDGVCIAEGNLDIDGKVICNGLYIGRPNDRVHVNLNPRAAEKVLARFPGFLSPNAIHVKKVYGD